MNFRDRCSARKRQARAGLTTPALSLAPARVLRCPSCALPMVYDLRCDWHACGLCARTLGGEVVWHKRKTRLGRLWLRVMCS